MPCQQTSEVKALQGFLSFFLFLSFSLSLSFFLSLFLSSFLQLKSFVLLIALSLSSLFNPLSNFLSFFLSLFLFRFAVNALADLTTTARGWQTALATKTTCSSLYVFLFHLSLSLSFF